MATCQRMWWRRRVASCPESSRCQSRGRRPCASLSPLSSLTHLHVARFDSVPLKSVDSSFQQRPRDEIVEPRDDHSDPQSCAVERSHVLDDLVRRAWGRQDAAPTAAQRWSTVSPGCGEIRAQCAASPRPLARSDGTRETGDSSGIAARSCRHARTLRLQLLHLLRLPYPQQAAGPSPF